jgi:predicted transcriptional regulator
MIDFFTDPSALRDKLPRIFTCALWYPNGNRMSIMKPEILQGVKMMGKVTSCFSFLSMQGPRFRNLGLIR